MGQTVMDDIDSTLTAAKEIAARLIRHNADVASAMKKRDVCLYKFFSAILELNKSLRKSGKPSNVRKALKARYGANLPTSRDPAMLAIKLAYPTLPPKKCSKYASVVRFVHRTIKSGESVRSFMQAHGRIKGCVEEERKTRPKRLGGGKAKK
jgi:hypothetical protein